MLTTLRTRFSSLYQRLWQRRRWWQRLLIMGMSLGIVGAIFLYAWLFIGLPNIDDLSDSLALPSSRIYDRNGRLLYEIVDLYGGSHRSIPLSEIAACMPLATVATEDANFYHHPGVDIEGIARALWLNIKGGEIQAGGSTITQQVARNLLLTKHPAQDRSLRRKMREGILALQLNASYSRDEILTLYLNQTYYGNLAYGVEAAAQTYFGKSPIALSLAECAMLAGLPQAPGQYNPLANPELAKARQEIVLELMVKHEAITSAQAQQAKAEALHYQSSSFNIQAPHFVAAVWTQLERNYPDLLLQGGLEVITTLDLDWQHAAERIANRHLNDLNNPPDGTASKNAHNTALVAIDPYTGEILTMLGSPDYFDEMIDGNVNAALAPRQPGSTLKPFTYAATFDPTLENAWTPATMILDVRTPFVTRRLESYTPANFGLVEHGPVLIREALASSYNIPAVVALDYIGVESLVKLTTSLGINTFTDINRFDLALTLGGGEVRLVELVGAYAAFPNGGQRIEPVYIQQIKDAEGNVIYEWEAPPLGNPELDPRVAFLINSILSDNNARIPSFGSGSVLNIGRPAAAKTGTTTDFRDNWTIGYTPNLVVGVWVGNANNTPMVNVSGLSGAGPIWNQFIREVLQGTPAYDFARPEGLVRAEVCAISGLLPTDACSTRVWDWFIEGTVPTEYDYFHQIFEIDTRTRQLADETTPAEFRKEEVFLVLPPEAREWAAKQGLEAPPNSATYIQLQPENPVRLTMPEPYTIFQLSSLTPRTSQRIQLNVITPLETVRLSYWLDGEQLVMLEEAPYSYWWELSAGAHELWAVAELADGQRINSPIIPFQVDDFVPSQLQLGQ